jgi:hypothetical protein
MLSVLRRAPVSGYTPEPLLDVEMQLADHAWEARSLGGVLCDAMAALSSRGGLTGYFLGGGAEADGGGAVGLGGGGGGRELDGAM